MTITYTNADGSTWSPTDPGYNAPASAIKQGPEIPVKGMELGERVGAGSVGIDEDIKFPANTAEGAPVVTATDNKPPVDEPVVTEVPKNETPVVTPVEAPKKGKKA